MTTTPPVVRGAVEGLVDEAVFRRLVQCVRASPGSVHCRNGKADLLRRLPGFNAAARHGPWLVLVDLDHDEDCAPPFRAAKLPDPAPAMCFRIAVREVEAWLLADRERFAEFLDVDPSRLPARPESVADPKEQVVALARRSRSRDVREDMVPREGSGRAEGPAYSSRLIEFVSDVRGGWRPTVAGRSADSLARCLRCLRRLVREASGP
jgi:hypothetical protein